MADHRLESLEGHLVSHTQFVERLARALIRDPGRAAELVQETWLAALRDPAAVTGGRGRSWLATVMRRRCVSKARRAQVRRTVELDDEAVATDITPPDIAARLERQRLVQDALRALREPFRTTLVLRYLDGLSAAQIARRTGLPPSTVRSHLARGLQQLREALDAQYPGGRAEWLAALAPLEPVCEGLDEPRPCGLMLFDVASDTWKRHANYFPDGTGYASSHEYQPGFLYRSMYPLPSGPTCFRLTIDGFETVEETLFVPAGGLVEWKPHMVRVP